MRQPSLIAGVLIVALFGAQEARAGVWHERVVMPALMSALQARYPSVTQWQVAPLGRSDALADQAVEVASRIDVLQLGPRSAVRVRSPAADGTLRQRTLWFTVAGIRRVLIATDSLAAGSALDESRVSVTASDVVSANCEPLLDPIELAGLRARVALRAGSVLCREALEPRPPVSRGEPVTVHYLGRVVALTARGVALGDGELGARIVVRNPESRELFRAVVTGPGEVTIHE